MDNGYYDTDPRVHAAEKALWHPFKSRYDTVGEAAQAMRSMAIVAVRAIDQMESENTVESRSDAFHEMGPTTVEERECYMQGLRAGVKLFSDMVPHLREANYEIVADGVERLAKVANRKVEEFADAALMP